MELNELLASEDSFRYTMLGRFQRDCEYYLGNGGRNDKHLWADTVPEHIEYMKGLWNSFNEDAKPEWLTWEEILDYESRMG